jgi:hypothetical protein
MKVACLFVVGIVLMSGCRKSEPDPSGPSKSSGGPQTKSKDVSPYHEKIRAEATEMNRLLMAGDLDGFLGYMHPKLIEKMGGAAAIKELLQPNLEQMRRQIERTTLGPISEVVTESDGLAAFVTIETIHQMNGSRFFEKSYLIASSADQGATWKFISSQGTSEQETLFKSMFPKLTGRIPFPRCETRQIK